MDDIRPKCLQFTSGDSSCFKSTTPGLRFEQAVFTAGMHWAWVLLAVQKYLVNNSNTICNSFVIYEAREFTYTNLHSPSLS